MVVGFLHLFKGYFGAGVFGVLRHIGKALGQLVVLGAYAEFAVYTALSVVAAPIPVRPAALSSLIMEAYFTRFSPAGTMTIMPSFVLIPVFSFMAL